MVRGLGTFRDHFREFKNSYILIGGAACELAMDNAGLDFRATKDLDIVLCVEALDKNFFESFWKFVDDGGYQLREKSEGDRQFYRFQKPTNNTYPIMLELFSRTPNFIKIENNSVLTPIPIDEDVSSLSAILLDETYYSWIKSGCITIDDIKLLGAEYIVPLKAKAWLDLSERKANGEKIDSRNIKKHKNDIFRLYQILDPTIEMIIPEVISRDIDSFLKAIANDKVDLEQFSLGKTTLMELIASLKEIYSL